MLEVSHLNVFYGESQAIRDVSFRVGNCESVAIMGRNGMGKTTLLKALIGMLPSRSGSIRVESHELAGCPSHQRVLRGLAFVPQGRMIFSQLTVEENILVGLRHAQRTVPEYIYRFFPVLAEMKSRRGGNLSGGQQQMLAIARALVTDPKVLILDEPTEGIQPSIIKDIGRVLELLRSQGQMAILLVEQYLDFAKALGDRLAVMDRGQVVLSGTADELDDADVRRYLTV